MKHLSIVTFTEWNVVGYNDVETIQHGRWSVDDPAVLGALIEMLVNAYDLKLTEPNTWERGGEFKGLVLHLEHTQFLKMDALVEMRLPSFTWLKNILETDNSDK